MTYVNNYTGEEHEERDECREDIIQMQESGKAVLLNVMHNYITGLIMSTPENDAMLRAGLDFIKDCVQFAEAHLEFGYDLDETFIDPYIEEVE